MLDQTGLGAAFPDRLFPWVVSIKRDTDVSDLIPKLRQVLHSDMDPEDMLSRVPSELLKTQKFDEFLSEKSLRAGAMGNGLIRKGRATS